MADFASQKIEKLIAEGPIGMTETARLLGTFRGGKPCHSSTPTRWCLSGIKLRSGRVLRLEHFRTAGRLMTSKPALLRFLAEQQDDKDLGTSHPVSPTERNRAAEAAGRELDQLGV
jgi:hypothetical protein